MVALVVHSASMDPPYLDLMVHLEIVATLVVVVSWLQSLAQTWKIKINQI